MLSINTNLSSLIAQNSMSSATKLLNQAVERMTTGYKINHAKDNAANYSISTNLTTKINAYMVAEDNCAMGLDMLSTANGSLDQISDKLTRLRDLQTQASNGTYGATSLNAINAEANALVDEINRLYQTAEYNGKKLLDSKELPPIPEDIGYQPVATYSERIRSTNYENFMANPQSYTDAEIADMKSLTEAFNESSFISGETYSISNIDELEKFRDMVNNGNTGAGVTFVLANDIDFSGISNWSPIGNDYYICFEGVFDGNGHKIINLSGTNGLFGNTDSGMIQNIGLENVNISSTYSDVGALVNEARNTSIINCYVKGTVSGSSYVGGLVGTSYTSIDKCYFEGTVSGSSNVGGLVGTSEGRISDCIVLADVNGTGNNIGGIMGELDGSRYNTSNLYYKGNLVGKKNVGGIAGYVDDFYIINCSVEGSIKGTDSVGGIFGYGQWGEMSSNYVNANVIGENFIGGLVGTANATGSDYVNINDCYVYETVVGNNHVGSFVGVQVGENNYGDTSELTLYGCKALSSEYNAVGAYASYNYDNNTSAIQPGRDLTVYDAMVSTINLQPIKTHLQVGINSGITSHIELELGFEFKNIDDLRMIGLDTTTDYLSTLDNMLSTVNAKQTEFGAVENRLNSALDEISIQYENLVSSRSTIRDADIAEVSSEYIRQQILQQASATLLSTANQSPSIALQLI